MTFALLLHLFALQGFVPVSATSPARLAAESGESGESGEDLGAQALWQAVVQASRVSASELAPIESFRIRANVLTRQGVQTNEGDVDLLFHAPDLIRFAMPDGKEVGRAGLKQRDYWLKSDQRVVALEGREYEEDRRQIQTMHAVARNFIALSDPARLTVSDVEMLDAPPTEIPDALTRTARGLTWLRVRSPDFALNRTSTTAPASAMFSVDFGLAPRGEDEHLPVLAVVRDAQRRGRTAPPMLIRLGQYATLDGFRVPHRVEVFALEPVLPYRFRAKPDQEIYLLSSSSLRAALTPEDFQP